MFVKFNVFFCLFLIIMILSYLFQKQMKIENLKIYFMNDKLLLPHV